MNSSTAPGAWSSGLRLRSYHDLDGDPGFKLALQRQGDRRYLYITHFWSPKLSILDVTDADDIRVVSEVHSPPEAAAWQIQVADGLAIQGLEHRPPAWGGDPNAGGEEGIRILDVSDPHDPQLLGTWRTGARGVHRNHYTGGRYVHVAASRHGFDGFIYVVLDIADPTAPREVAQWFLPEQWTASGKTPELRRSFHGPAYLDGDLAYLPYGGGGVVTLDVSRIDQPRLVSRLDIGAAFSSHVAMHTAIPLASRGIAIVNTEAIAEDSREPLNFAGIVDISDPAAPRLLSTFPVPVPTAEMPFPNFHTRGGRFGPHNQHHPQDPDTLYSSDTIVFMTWFNAGLRVYDTSDPYLPREIAWYLPHDPEVRRGLLPTKLVTQTEDVLVDDRGLIFMTDKNHGLHVLELEDGAGRNASR